MNIRKDRQFEFSFDLLQDLQALIREDTDLLAFIDLPGTGLLGIAIAAVDMPEVLQIWEAQSDDVGRFLGARSVSRDSTSPGMCLML
mgnify:CR=1 FL=1